jgi:hypothetical protein
MAGISTELTVAAKLAWSALKKRLNGTIEPLPDLVSFSANMQQLLDNTPADIIDSYYWLDINAKQPPWLASKAVLTTGDNVSCFAAGRIYANKFLDIYVPLSMQIWFKIGAGDIFRGTQDSHSFVAQGNGPLQFGNYFPNDWQSPAGDRQQDDNIYAASSGDAKILIIKWSLPILDGLKKLAAIGDVEHRLRNEINRIEQGPTTPMGWNYLWNIGPSDIYRDKLAAGDSACISCHTNGNTGILQKAVDIPLDESSEISWRWCIHQLASTIREDAVPSHDYLSIAVEFDNGRDITYYWSSTLPFETGYDCPLPNWKGKEYHVVIRSGEQGLGQWQNERRNLYQDYQRYMGDPPARIKKIWLIANSVFQRNNASCDYSDIVLHHDDESHQVL